MCGSVGCREYCITVWPHLEVSVPEAVTEAVTEAEETAEEAQGEAKEEATAEEAAEAETAEARSPRRHSSSPREAC